MKESRFVEWLSESGVCPRAGDDAAVVDACGGRLLFSSDMVVEGVHFRREDPPLLVGRKAVAVSLSDIAAMGGRPLFCTVSVGMPGWMNEESSRELMEGARRVAAEFGIEIVGGDTVASPVLCVDVAMLGDPLGEPVGRDGASPSEMVFVTGSLGGSLLGRHLRFVPRVKEVQRILEVCRPTAMIDVSDGLVADLLRILRGSGVAARLAASSIPVSMDARRAAERDGRSALEHAMFDGEDFELLFTVKPEDARVLASYDVGVPLRCIGRIVPAVEGEVVYVEDASCGVRVFREGGYEHEW